MKGIKISNLSKKYGNVVSVDNISFNFEFGKIYGFFGQNGAGKTSVVNMITNRIFPDSGDIFIDDNIAVENREVRNKIFCTTVADLYESSMSVEDIFKWSKKFYDVFNIDTAKYVANKFNLDINKKFGELSTGYKSILKVTVALAMNVDYLIFDEPVIGFDANHREKFYELLLENYENNKKTIILSTHLIEEVSNIVEHVVIIDKGKIIVEDSVENLLMRGYSVSGHADIVDEYCIDKEVIAVDEIGGFKIAYIMGKYSKSNYEDKLDISSMGLQKLFIKLTEGK